MSKEAHDSSNIEAPVLSANDLLTQKVEQYKQAKQTWNSFSGVYSQDAGKATGIYLGLGAILNVFDAKRPLMLNQPVPAFPDQISTDDKNELLAVYSDAYLHNALTTRPKISLKDMALFRVKSLKELGDFRVAGNLAKYEIVKDFMIQAGLVEEIKQKDNQLQKMVEHNPDILRTQLNEQAELNAQQSLTNFSRTIAALSEDLPEYNAPASIEIKEQE